MEVRTFDDQSPEFDAVGLGGVRTCDGDRLVGQSNMGLTGFDISICGRACDPSCSDSLNGAKNRIANEQFAYAA